MALNSSNLPRFGGARYSDERKCLLRDDGSEISLRPQSLAVFKVLAERADSVTTKDTLLELVWPTTVVTEDSLTQCIADIRRAIGDTERQVLRTVPRQGYMLVADEHESTATDRESAVLSPGPAFSKAPFSGKHAAAEKQQSQPDRDATVLSGRRARSGLRAKTIWLGAFAAMIAVSWLVIRPPAATGNASQATNSPVEHPTTNSQALTEAPQFIPAGSVPTLSIVVREATQLAAPSFLAPYLAELRSALSRYKAVALVDSAQADTDYQLAINIGPGEQTGQRLLVEAIDVAANQVFSSRSFDVPDHDGAARQLAIRTAAFASPAGGDLSRHLMATALHKPVDKLSPAECYAHAYDCTSCAGELTHITERTSACLKQLLDENPNNYAAWALKGALHAHQYRWGSALPEPERTDLYARGYLSRMAVEAATRAEELSDGSDPVVYWGLVQAYQSTCEIDKMRAAAKRGLALNPHDPGTLAVFGNWLAFAGDWDDGTAMIERALEIEPTFYRRWWLMGPAKRHYFLGEFELANTAFQDSFGEHNWLSHLHQAYTLPHLGRADEAREAVERVMRLNPGITLEKALQYHQIGCLPKSYLDKVKTGLVAGGLPSRGRSDAYRRVETIPAKLANVNGAQLEYIDIGQGEPIVFIHGGFADYRAWSHYETPISERHRFIAYTQRYYGPRDWPKPDKPPTQYTFSDDLIAFIETLRLGPVHLVTWSGGGRVGMIAQASRPDLIKSAIHFEPVADAILEDPSQYAEVKHQVFGRRSAAVAEMVQKHGDWRGAVMRVWEIVSELPDGAFHHEVPGVQRMFLDNAETLLLSRSINRDMFTCDYVAQIRSPTLIVNGRGTNDYWKAMANRFAQCIPGATSAVLPGGNHDAPIRNVDGFVSLIRSHVDRHSGGAPKRTRSGQPTLKVSHEIRNNASETGTR